MVNSTYIVSSDRYAEHLTGEGHPESPDRFWAIKRGLEQALLMTSQNTLTPRLATKDEILLCHDETYLKAIAHRISHVRGVECILPDILVCRNSFEVALLAAGGVLKGVDAVFEGKAKNVFCLTRPPGHHACKDIGMGFCLFNNVAIAARYAQKNHGIEKVAIVDWDVHHGNGTQNIFEIDPSVLYFSTHGKSIYPGTGKESEIGVGNIINCPISGGVDSWEKILVAFQERLVPVLDKFKPDLILISAGFDAHRNDPLGGLEGGGGFNLVESNFAELTAIVKKCAAKHCEGRIVSVLEGGYNLEALAMSVGAHVRALTGF